MTDNQLQLYKRLLFGAAMVSDRTTRTPEGE